MLRFFAFFIKNWRRLFVLLDFFATSKQDNIQTHFSNIFGYKKENNNKPLRQKCQIQNQNTLLRAPMLDMVPPSN